MNINEYAGNKIREARGAHDMTQSDLAVKCGTSYQSVQKWESGKTDLSLGRLSQIAEIFKLPISYFFPDKQDESFLLALRTDLRMRDYALSQIKRIAEELA